MPPLYQSIPWRLDGFNKISCNSYATQLQASTQATGSSRCRLLGDCERRLLNDAVAVPLFAQQKRLLIAPDIRNLIFAPFGPVLDLTYTTKNDVKETLKSRRPILLAGAFWTTAFLYRRFFREKNVVFIHKTQFFAACAASKPQNCFQSHAVISWGPSRRA